MCLTEGCKRGEKGGPDGFLLVCFNQAAFNWLSVIFFQIRKVETNAEQQ